MGINLGTTLYKVMFGDEPETFLDPNKEENQAVIKAQREAAKEEYKMFWNSTGKPLLERFQAKLRVGLFDLLKSDPECSCESCIKIRELSTITKMLAEAEMILNKE